MEKTSAMIDLEPGVLEIPPVEKKTPAVFVVRRMSTRVISHIGSAPGNLVRRTSELLQLISWPSWSSQASDTSSTSEAQVDEAEKVVQIEDFPRGYPRFSAFVAALDNFQVFRRFSHVRARLLLLKQDRIAELEEKLNEIDEDEPRVVFRATRRGDKNPERKALLDELDSALESYDNLLTRNQQVSAFRRPHSRDVENVVNWLDWNPCVAPEETTFLSRHEDLLVLNSDDDRVLSWLDRLVTLWFRLTGRKSSHGITRDENVHIFHKESVEMKARLLLTPALILVLLTPVIICDILPDLTQRLIVIIVATSLFITLLSVLSRAKTVELAVAGSTYATVLLVFITNNS